MDHALIHITTSCNDFYGGAQAKGLLEQTEGFGTTSRASEGILGGVDLMVLIIRSTESIKFRANHSLIETARVAFSGDWKSRDSAGWADP